MLHFCTWKQDFCTLMAEVQKKSHIITYSYDTEIKLAHTITFSALSAKNVMYNGLLIIKMKNIFHFA